MKKFNIIAGLPRSGSTLLCNILNQNPKFHSSATSGLVTVMDNIKSNWESVPGHKVNIDWEQKKNVLKGIPQLYYDHLDSDFIFDKNREWLRHPNMAKFLFGDDVRFILCVRSLTEILASFEKLYRKQSGYFTVVDEANAPEQMKTKESRVNLWAGVGSPVTRNLELMKDFLTGGYDNKFTIIEYKSLVKNPKRVIEDLYADLGIDYFDHNYNKVEQTTTEEDLYHGYLGLHDIRPKVEFVKSDAISILGSDLFKKYSGGEFWRNIDE